MRLSIDVFVANKRTILPQRMPFKERGANDNAGRSRRTIIQRIIKDVITDDPYLKPLRDMNFPFGYLSPDQNYPQALFLVHTNMLCRNVQQVYGNKIAKILRHYLEGEEYRMHRSKRASRAMQKALDRSFDS